MSIEFRCPNCEKKLRTADEKAGKTAKCPQCGTPVVVPGATQAEDDFNQFPEFDDIEDQTGVMPPRSGRSAVAAEVVCPMCGAKNDARATRCLSCGEDLGDAVAATTGRLPSLRFGDIWASAWEKWTANLGLCVGAAAIAGLILFLMFMVAYALLILVAVLGFGAAGGGGNNIGPAVIGLIVAVIFAAVASLALMAYMQVGLSNFSLTLARRLPGNLADIFPGMNKLPAALVCQFVVYLAFFVLMIPAYAVSFGGQAMMLNDNAAGIFLILLGYPLQFGASVLMNLFFWPIPYMIASRQTGLFSSLLDGPKLAVYDWKLSFLLAIVNLGLSFLGSLVCGIGLLFTYPLSFLLFAVAYERLSKHVRLAQR